MPDKTGRLTPMEGIFAKHYGETGDATYAATKAGYSQPVVIGSQKRQDPRIQAASRAAARDRLRSEGAEVGVRVLIEIASDVKQPSGARVNAAVNLVKHSGISAEGTDTLEPHEMTPEQIARTIGELERNAAAQAKEVNAHRVDEPDTGVFG